MRILVSGSSGTIGTRLCEKLLERGDTVVGVDWLPNKWQPSINEVTHIVDMRHEDEMQRIPADNIDVFIHLAANARVYELVEHPERARDNFLTLFNALEFCRQNNVKKFIFASSRECYGNSESDKYTEDMVRVEHCESPYTASKVGGEALVEAYHRCYNIDHITFRFSNVYGMYDDSIRVVPLFVRKARANEPMTVFGKGKCLDFTYIDDCVQGIMKAVDHWEIAKNDTYNLAYGAGTTLIKLAERVKELIGASSEIGLGPSRTGEVIRYVADISKAKKIFGYSPEYSFDKGIEKAVEWYGKHT